MLRTAIILLVISSALLRSSSSVNQSTTTFVPPTVPCVADGCPTKPPSDFRRTVIFVAKQTVAGQNVFIRGSLGSEHFPECGTIDDFTSPCAIPIEINSLGNTAHYDAYNAYRVGDDRLDWGGAQPTQGTFSGKEASGTAMVLTSNSESSPDFQPLNVWGEFHWMVDMEMDCAKSADGWFEVKALVDAGEIWELDVSQLPCSGNGASTPPYSSKNHMARCGYINKFTFSSGGCVILNF